MIFLTSDSACGICNLFSSDAKLRCPNCPWNIRNVASSRLSTLLKWCQDAQKGRCRLQFNRPIRLPLLDFALLHLELPNSKVHITSARTHETPERSVQRLSARIFFAICNVASLINWVAVANSSLGCIESKVCSDISAVQHTRFENKKGRTQLNITT